MRRWVVEPGRRGIDALAIKESPTPEPGRDEVRVAVRAVSVNYRDQIVLNGDYGQAVQRDTVVASDGAGVVDAVGEGVTSWGVGDRVVGKLLRRLGRGSAAAGHGLRARLAGAGRHARAVRRAGGVSLFALLLGKALGAEVIVTTSREAKAARLREMGADDVNYRETPNWGEEVFASTGGVDEAVNAAGGDAMEQSIMVVGPGGEIAVMGLFSAADAAPPLPVLMSKGASIRGTSVGSPGRHRCLRQDRHRGAVVAPPGAGGGAAGGAGPADGTSASSSGLAVRCCRGRCRRRPGFGPGRPARPSGSRRRRCDRRPGPST